MTVNCHEIMAAKALLKLPDRASMADIKSSYRMLIKKWHPDKCNGNEGNDEECHEMARKITTAYNTIVAYCRQYWYAFTEEEVKRYLSPEQWWFERFGDDPLMGKIKKH